MQQLILLFAIVLSASSVLAKDASLDQLSGKFYGIDQLKRPCQVEITKQADSHSFSAVDYRGETFEVNEVKNSELHYGFVVDPENSERAHLTHYQYVGSEDPVFGTYPETRSVTAFWHDGEVSSVSIEIRTSGGNYGYSDSIMCMR